jgi:formiminotetrahydrofolate cyclodeaminase
VHPDLGSLSLEELLDELAREAPVPGAGPAAALVVAAAAALAAMAARAARDSWADAAAAVAQAEALRARAVDLAAQDAAAVEGVLAARISDGVPSEARDFRLGEALGRAADAPLAIVEAACDAALLAAHAAERGGGDAGADAAAAAFLAAGAARAAAHLVEVNLASRPGDARLERARGLVRTAVAAADEAARS